MGFISSISRSVRNNRLTRKLSTSKPRYDDSRDLIKISSNVGSLTRVTSHSLSPTIVQPPESETLFPPESPSRRKALSPADFDLQSLFDNAEALDPSNRAMKTLSMPPNYPIYKLDTVNSHCQSPKKHLQAPIETEEWAASAKKGHRKSIMSRSDKRKSNMLGKNENSRSKIRQSISGFSDLLKRGSSVYMPRSSLSMKTLRSSSSQKWFDTGNNNSDDSLAKEEAEVKWLELNCAASEHTGRAFEFWGNQAFVRRYC